MTSAKKGGEKPDIVRIKLRLLDITGMLDEDEVYTRENAVKDLTEVIRWLDEAEPKI